MNHQPSRLLQLDPRWLAYSHAKATGIRPDAMQGCDPETIYSKCRKYFASAMGFEDDKPLEYTEDGIAIVSVIGMLYKDEPSNWVTTYAALGEALDELLEEAPPRAVVLRIDSPGGQVAGLEEICRKVYELANKTLVVASIVGDGESAAYRIASQAGSIWASPESEIGSIGTWWQLLDMSAAYAADGIRSVLLTTGTLKGVGVMGEPITPEQTAFLQAKVDEQNARFLDDVAAGRSMTPEQVAAVADGRWWIAAEAQSLGLIDEVGDMSAVLSAIRSQLGVTLMPREKLAPATTSPAAVADAPPQTQAAPETPEPVQAEPPAPIAAAPDLAQYMATFGDADGARMFRDGLQWQDALQTALTTARGQIQDLQAELAQVKGRMGELAQQTRGEDAPIQTGATDKKRSISEAFGTRLPSPPKLR